MPNLIMLTHAYGEPIELSELYLETILYTIYSLLPKYKGFQFIDKVYISYYSLPEMRRWYR